MNREIITCDTLLAQMQELLHIYQHDLSGVANEIRSLQVSFVSRQFPIEWKCGHFPKVGEPSYNG